MSAGRIIRCDGDVAEGAAWLAAHCPRMAAALAQTSASFLSNVFRYRMIRDTGAVWIDCDAFCHRPFPDETDHIYAGHGFRGARAENRAPRTTTSDA